MHSLLGLWLSTLASYSFVSRVVWIHLIGAVVSSRLIGLTVWISLVGTITTAGLVGRVVRVHLVGVVILICLFLVCHLTGIVL